MLSLPSKNILSLFFGVLIGLLLGLCFNFDSENEEDAAHRILVPSATSTSNDQPIWLQCLILIEPSTKNPHKHVSAILDTYASRCNDSIFLTNSKALQDKFADKANIFLVDSQSFDPSEWRWLYAALQIANGRGEGTRLANGTQPLARWVAVLSERNYLVVRNFRHIICPYAAQSLIAGHIVKLKSVFKYLLPFTHLDAFRMDGGVILSGAALDAILGASNECSPNSWFTPRYAGKALLSCARKVGVREWSPVDEETGQSIFVTTDLRTLFESAASPIFAAYPLSIRPRADEKPVVSDEEKGAQTSCCSHRVICFGSLDYHDLRLIYFFADNSLSVYGV